MDEFNIIIVLISIIAGAAPIVIASIGETISEKAGVINLSLDGTILLSAMGAFVITYNTQSLILGFALGAMIGVAIASLVGIFSIYLNQSQVAVGFVLTLTAKELAYFLGNPYSRMYGPQVEPLSIPILKDIPIMGQILFQQNVLVYFSFVLIIACYWFIYYSTKGLNLRSVGEHPEAAYARGLDPRKTQMIYVLLGGMLVGLAGAAFSLCVKPGWGRPQGAEGMGWIALAIVIFGGWHPVKAAIGAYLFSFLQVMGIYFQGWWTGVPAQLFQVAPFPLMIFALVLTNWTKIGTDTGSAKIHPLLRKFVNLLSGAAPASLGKPFRPG